jgi:hypothetical protein
VEAEMLDSTPCKAALKKVAAEEAERRRHLTNPNRRTNPAPISAAGTAAGDSQASVHVFSVYFEVSDYTNDTNNNNDTKIIMILIVIIMLIIIMILIIIMMLVIIVMVITIMIFILIRTL